MKLKMSLSNQSLIFTIAILIFILYSLYASTNVVPICIISFFLILGCALGLFYMPMSISLEEEEIWVNRSLWVKKIPLKDIVSIELKELNKPAARICGSDGWFGYWGWFKDSDLGWYFMYSGMIYSEYIFIRLKNGRQYIIGCDNPEEAIDYVRKQICSLGEG